MKILVASDLHYRLKQFDWLERQADDYDAIVIAGDMLDISSYLDLNVQIVVITNYLKKISQKTHLLVCSGNHDGNEKNEADEFIAPWLQEIRNRRLSVDGDNVYFGNTLITIFPWWDGEVTKLEVSEQFEKASRLQYERWIWIYHAPPDNSPTSWAGKRFIGDIELNKWIDRYQPDLVISGHIHESPFKPDGSWADRIGKTWVLNAGSYIGDVPPHIVIYLEAMDAEWYSLAGNDIRQLSVTPSQ
ncbi:MAG: metallophosphoesterase family protein [Gammaproteobacteria bacterium]